MTAVAIASRTIDGRNGILLTDALTPEIPQRYLEDAVLLDCRSPDLAFSIWVGV